MNRSLQWLVERLIGMRSRVLYVFVRPRPEVPEAKECQSFVFDEVTTFLWYTVFVCLYSHKPTVQKNVQQTKQPQYGSKGVSRVQFS